MRDRAYRARVEAQQRQRNYRYVIQGEHEGNPVFLMQGTEGEPIGWTETLYEDDARTVQGDVILLSDRALADSLALKYGGRVRDTLEEDQGALSASELGTLESLLLKYALHHTDIKGEDRRVVLKVSRWVSEDQRTEKSREERE